MQISNNMSRRIEHAISGLTPEPIGHVNFDGILYHALPVFGTLGEVWLLRADGSLWMADSETNVPLEPLPAELHTIAIAAGVERYPWLEPLLPPRPPDARNCTNCKGSGRVGPANALYCHACGALGWQPE